jgi:hypothetical protein
MRRFVITGALVANGLASGLVLLELLNGDGWGKPATLSVTTVQLLVVAAAAALALTLVLAPVLGISFWARDRGARRLEARLATPAARAEPDASRTVRAASAEVTGNTPTGRRHPPRRLHRASPTARTEQDASPA